MALFHGVIDENGNSVNVLNNLEGNCILYVGGGPSLTNACDASNVDIVRVAIFEGQ